MPNIHNGKVLDYGLLLQNKKIVGLLKNFWINIKFNGKEQKSMIGT